MHSTQFTTIAATLAQQCYREDRPYSELAGEENGRIRCLRWYLGHVHLQGWDLGGFIEFEPCFLKRTSGICQPCRHYVGHVVTSNNYLSA